MTRFNFSEIFKLLIYFVYCEVAEKFRCFFWCLRVF